MFEKLIELDHSLFYLINTSLANSWFDTFFPLWTNFHKLQIFLYLIAPVLLIYTYWKARGKGLALVISAVLMTTALDQFIRIIKPVFNRPRPFVTENLPFEVIFRGDPQGGLSFPSGHAADGFFIAVFLGLYFPKLRWLFLTLATLTAYSRVYCGVHYPSDVLGGAVLGIISAWLAFFLINKIRQSNTVFLSRFVFLALIIFSQSGFSFEDPTQGKPFLPWLWQDQFKPTIQNGFDDNGFTILGVGALTTIAAHQYDTDVVEHNRKGHDLLMDRRTSKDFARVGSGALGVGIAIAQIIWDQPNGLMHARALALTTLSHVSLSFIFQRERPDGRGDYLPFPSSYPSGHASSAFATAGSLTYAYGWKAGVPAYTVATAIAISRVAENAHWISDITSGITLGVFWARASYLAHSNPTAELNWMPIPTNDGLAIYYQHRF
ncbi:MAG: phosphatase PAP2 family protein [Bdellovibrionota bacterium]